MMIFFICFSILVLHVIASNFTCNDSQCQYSNITCTDNEDCFIYCGFEGCKYAQIIGPLNGDLFINATNTYALKYSYIQAPTYGNITITTSKNYAFSSATLNASHMIQGSFKLYSIHQEITSKEFQAEIYCPGNGILCDVECGAEGCTYFTFYTQSDSNLDILAEGLHAMKGANVHCPTNGDCIIKARDNSVSQQNKFGVLNDVTIFSVNGLIRAKLEGRLSQLYWGNNGIRLQLSPNVLSRFSNHHSHLK